MALESENVFLDGVRSLVIFLLRMKQFILDRRVQELNWPIGVFGFNENKKKKKWLSIRTKID